MKETDLRPDPDTIDRILDRGVIANILPSEEKFRERLLSGEKLCLYIGADPNSTHLHLGHAGNLLLLEELRKLGHEVIVLFGTFTARIGDPTDKSSTRGRLTELEVNENVRHWLAQIKPILGFDDPVNPVEVRYNHEWLSKLTFEDVVQLASNFTVQQMLERDMFEKRMEEGRPIFLHEFFYPLMQGYDSVALEVDAELGGTDQTFNMLAGRLLSERYLHKDKFVIATNLVADKDTGALMSKSAGTGVFLDLDAGEMYGAIMAQPDGMMEPLFINCTRIPLEEKDAIFNLGPKDAKMRIAREIVGLFHGQQAAEAAENNFVETFSNRGIPSDIEAIGASIGERLVDILLSQKVIESKTEWRRLVDSGAVTNAETGEKVTSHDVTLTAPITLKVGKRRFLKINTN